MSVNVLQWNLCIIDTLGPTKSVLIIMIFQVSLYDKTPLGTITKCVDYAVILISSVLINKFYCSYALCIYRQNTT